MQVVVIETGDQVRIERRNVRKGQGRTLGVFTNQDGKGQERAADYVTRKRHTIVDRKVVGEAKRQADLREIEALLGPVGTFARGA